MTSPSQLISVSVYDKGAEGDEFAGECELPMAEFANQRSKEVWRDLHGPKGAKRWEGMVNLKVHFIHSTVKLLRDIVAESERELRLIERVARRELVVAGIAAPPPSRPDCEEPR